MLENENFYEYAFNYAASMVNGNRDLVKSIVRPDKETLKPKTISDLNLRLLSSIKNANQKDNVIGDLERLRKVLEDFDAVKIIKKYGNEEEKLMQNIFNEVPFKKSEKLRKTKRSIWPQFCKAILSSAQFLIKFEDTSSFFAWADKFTSHTVTAPALPLVLSEEIHGLGYALACDFVKEIGYTEFGKPDVNVKDILTQLELCPEGLSDYFIQKKICELAKEYGVSAYQFDKVLYLIGSGRFGDEHNLKVKRQRLDFIKQASRDKAVWFS